MSYCRFSTPNCDLYVYLDVGGFVSISVAGRRWKHERKIGFLGFPETPPIDELCDDNNWENIGLPADGESYEERTFQGAADRVRALKEMGYRVPDWVIPGLQAEADAGKKCDDDDL